MTNYKTTQPTIDEIKQWINNKLINPRTNKKIKLNGPTYIILQNKYLEFLEQNLLQNDNLSNNNLSNNNLSNDNLQYIDRYIEFRKNKTDPILLIDLPYDNYQDKHFFKFEYKWDPYTGERLEKDSDGPLYFDPDSLIYYFHLHRLKKLWINGSDGFHGFYGDALGTGPDFFIKGRGHHPEWYLFRLPIHDCYLSKDHNNQHITLGPVLTDKEIMRIDKLANNFGNNYYNTYGIRRPKLIKIKQYYDQAISKQPKLNIPKDIEFFLEIHEHYQLQLMRNSANKKAVEILKIL
jgi:hypothetical protein